MTLSTEFTFSVGDDEFFGRRWIAAGEPKGAVGIVHGYGEHCGRYDQVARYFAGRGYEVYSYDQRGHGQSPGERAYIDNFDHYVGDLSVFLDFLMPQLTLPFFLMGQSMGGLVLARYAVQHAAPARGLIFSSAALAVSRDISPMLQRVSGVLGAMAPRLPVVPLDTSGFSRDPAVALAYQRDPLVHHGKVMAGTGAAILSATRDIQERMSAISLPLLILHGTADPICEPEGSRKLYGQAAAVDKTLKLYEGGYHELYNDLVKEEMLADIVSWLDARV